MSETPGVRGEGPGASDREQPMRGPARMSFAQAKAFVIRFGQYKTRALDAIAETDKGLQYLDWLCGGLESDCKSWQAPTLEALQVYLGEPAIKAEVAKLVNRPRVKNAIANTAAERDRQELWGE